MTVWFDMEPGEVPLMEGVGPTGEMKSVSDGSPDGSSVKIVESVGTENPVSLVILESRSEVRMEDRPEEVMREVMGNVPFPDVVSLAGGKSGTVPFAEGVGGALP